MPRILVVADSQWVKNDVHSALGLPGYELQDHVDPRTLVEAVDDFAPDVAIIDLQVASMGGMAMVRSLREAALDSGFHKVPVILLLDRSADAFLAKRAAADVWIHKPFHASELRDEVAALLTQESTGGA